MNTSLASEETARRRAKRLTRRQDRARFMNAFRAARIMIRDHNEEQVYRQYRKALDNGWWAAAAGCIEGAAAARREGTGR